MQVLFIMELIVKDTALLTKIILLHLHKLNRGEFCRFSHNRIPLGEVPLCFPCINS